MSEVVENSILTAAAFNAIPSFDDQTCSMDTETLSDIAAIFIEHDMHLHFGAGLLHRHEKLPDKSVMLHKTNDSGNEICFPTPLSSVDITSLEPHSWYLNQDEQFQAFEYVIGGEAKKLDPAFAFQLRNFLQACDLENQISIIPSPARLGDTIKFTHPYGSGTICMPLHLVSEHDREETEVVPVGWSFHVNQDGVIGCEGKIVCAKKKNGSYQAL